MGKSVSSASRLVSLAKAPKKHTKPTTPKLIQLQHNNNNKKMQSSNTSNFSDKNISTSQNGVETRVPLSEVVSDCVKRWFKDALKEAKTGDINMQVLVAQMYYKGFGVTRDAQKGRVWMTRASRTRSSVWKVSDKHPGYNASDSDSDELNDDSE